MTDYIYDIESLDRIFTLTARNADTRKKYVFEVSPRRNDFKRLKAFMDFLVRTNARMVGYNNLAYDYPLLHHLIKRLPSNTKAATVVGVARKKTNQLIATPFGQGFLNYVKNKEVIVPQIDLMKINHYDNQARTTSLKMLEFVSRRKNISEFDMDNYTDDQADEFLEYNETDVDAAHNFMIDCEKQISFREELSERYGYDMMNFNDTKIGEWVLIKALEEKLGDEICYYYDQGKRKMRQSPRDEIVFEEILFDYLEFNRPEFKAIHEWMSKQVITETKGVFADLPLDELGDLINYLGKVKNSRIYGCEIIESLHCVADDLKFIFGLGGLHASVESRSFVNGYNQQHDMEYIMKDCDVTSMYPSLAIQNALFPEHLTAAFCPTYAQLLQERLKHPKGAIENAMLKLALNGAYGKSNSIYSPLYDPKFTMAITINGQLSLLMLCEKLMEIDGLEIIQVNTDGVTAYFPAHKEDEYDTVCKAWEKTTKLTLEYADYHSMFVRDVNNYIAVYDEEWDDEFNYKVKRKGTYEYDRLPHQNQSMMVVPRCAEQVLLYGADPEKFLHEHDDLFDYCGRTKVPRTSRLEGEDAMGERTRLQNITRYVVTTDGLQLDKIMPPLAKKPGVERHISIEKGFVVTDLSDWVGVEDVEIDYDYYLNEVKKITEPILIPST